MESLGQRTIVDSVFDGGQRGDNTLCQTCESRRCNGSGRVRTAGLVTLPSAMGTLKSTRMRTRLPLRSRSVMESLFAMDMVGCREGWGDRWWSEVGRASLYLRSRRSFDEVRARHLPASRSPFRSVRVCQSDLPLRLAKSSPFLVSKGDTFTWLIHDG